MIETVFYYEGDIISKKNFLIPNIEIGLFFIFDSIKYCVRDFHYKENDLKDCFTLFVTLEKNY